MKDKNNASYLAQDTKKRNVPVSRSIDRTRYTRA